MVKKTVEIPFALVGEPWKSLDDPGLSKKCKANIWRVEESLQGAPCVFLGQGNYIVNSGWQKLAVFLMYHQRLKFYSPWKYQQVYPWKWMVRRSDPFLLGCHSFRCHMSFRAGTVHSNCCWIQHHGISTLRLGYLHLEVGEMSSQKGCTCAVHINHLDSFDSIVTIINSPKLGPLMAKKKGSPFSSINQIVEFLYYDEVFNTFILRHCYANSSSLFQL